MPETSRFCTNCGYSLMKSEDNYPNAEELDTLQPSRVEQDSASQPLPTQPLDEVYPQRSIPAQLYYKKYNRIRAAFLSLFLGGFGIHKFYLDKPIQGVLYFVLSVTGISSVLGLIEGIRYFALSNEHFEEIMNRKY